jgi:hypothetical protein
VTQGAFWSKLLQEQIEEALPEGVMGRWGGQGASAADIGGAQRTLQNTLHDVLPWKSPLDFANLVWLNPGAKREIHANVEEKLALSPRSTVNIICRYCTYYWNLACVDETSKRYRVQLFFDWIHPSTCYICGWVCVCARCASIKSITCLKNWRQIWP